MKMRFKNQSLRFDDIKMRIQSIIKNSNFNVSLENNFDQIALEYIKSVLSLKEIINLLNCVPNIATKSIKKLLELNLIEKVEGSGKGKYKFI